MKNLKNLIILLILFLASNSLGMIHETMEQCDKRYGEPESIEKHKDGEITRYYNLKGDWKNYHMSISFHKDKAMYLMYGKFDGKARVYDDWKFEDKWVAINKKDQGWHEVDDNKKGNHSLKHEWHWLRTDGFILMRMDVAKGLWIVQDMRYNTVTKKMVK